jgi:hypothetical protein
VLVRLLCVWVDGRWLGIEGRLRPASQGQHKLRANLNEPPQLALLSISDTIYIYIYIYIYLEAGGRHASHHDGASRGLLGRVAGVGAVQRRGDCSGGGRRLRRRRSSGRMRDDGRERRLDRHAGGRRGRGVDAGCCRCCCWWRQWRQWRQRWQWRRQQLLARGAVALGLRGGGALPKRPRPHRHGVVQMLLLGGCSGERWCWMGEQGMVCT